MPPIAPRFIAYRSRWLLLILLWMVAVGISLGFSLQTIRRHSLEVAAEGARNMFHTILLTRQWSARHGGVYVPVGPETQPNPYLVHPRRDITTTDGTRLTLINPAYMTRLISELADQRSGVTFHITSLKPIRPGNAADTWERQALIGFQNGLPEMLGFEGSEQDDGPLLRYMAPLRLTQDCLACHADQGPVNGIRGGISINQRYRPFEIAARPSEIQTLLTHGVVFLLVAGLGWWLLEQLRRSYFVLTGKIGELEAAQDELLQSEKMASLGRMVAGFAHEINTPVGVAVGAVSNNEEVLNGIDRLLEQEDVREDKLRAELDVLRQGSVLALANLRRAADLVQSFKRTSADQASQQPRVFSMGELIQDVRFSLHNPLKRLPIRIDVDCPDKLTLNGVPGLIEQLLTNLILNSLQHGFSQGSRAGTITIRVETPSVGQVAIDYRDDGLGMPPEVVARVFEPFFTTRRGQGGSGLGLYICYNIVTTELKGTIHCESTPGAGTHFRIVFPATLPGQNQPIS
jgi:two-component system NtrC family sensor kinase